MTNSGGSSPTNHDTKSHSASRRKRFVLSGHSAALDPAIHAVRDDLADVELADRVFAPHYSRALAYSVAKAATVYVKPNADTATVDSVTLGMMLDVFDLNAGWAWVRTEKGMGYVLAEGLSPA